MSIKVDPSKCPPPPPPREPSCGFRRIVELFCEYSIEGYKQETMPSRQYCQEKWDERHRKPTESYDAFMDQCVSGAEAAKRFAEWHRRN